MHQTDDARLDGPLLFGRVLDGRGGGRRIGWEEAQSWQPQAPGEVLWLHLCRTESGVQNWLESLGIPEPTAELLVSDETRPRAFREGTALVATLRGINFNPGAEPEDMVAMQLWCDGPRLFTLRRQRLQSPRDVLAMIDRGSGPVDAGRVITELVEALINRMNASIVDMNAAIDDMEERGTESDTEAAITRIANIRRNSLALQRHMAPQHEALEIIARTAPAWFEDDDKREIAESIDRLRRYLEDINISKESAVVLQDDIRARALARSERTNYLLTIVAAIFLPLGFITGLLGINVGGMPGVDDGDAFWIVVGLCGVILTLQLALFWRWKWL
ncbi:zinc transporter ZntB [Aurantiacibacter gangjinensis]|uniref:Magnesium transporter n=1 Tax=Aurantiacibacter gangjinensis TaxID=502682 RepID=A0A0G9MKK5_9SPHN|nr:zinc transporter ZntB [Aurantiacibacter gangjinensis]APE29301.1 Magnesium and cobalt transport protein CorA [Aurantiacibacter gangjinensis]KLE31212.1 magnesium transporter [Aurantiacibacter gangjinensis]